MKIREDCPECRTKDAEIERLKDDLHIVCSALTTFWSEGVMDDQVIRDTTGGDNIMQIEGKCETHGYEWCYRPDHPRATIGCPVCAAEEIADLRARLLDADNFTASAMRAQDEMRETIADLRARVTRLEAAARPVKKWLEWWLSERDCECVGTHSCGFDERYAEWCELNKVLEGKEG